MTLYETLGVQPGVSDDEIRTAYRRAARTAHPDLGGSAEAAALVNAAYERLRDDRASYDRELRDAENRPDGDAETFEAEELWEDEPVWDEVIVDEPPTARHRAAEPPRRHWNAARFKWTIGALIGSLLALGTGTWLSYDLALAYQMPAGPLWQPALLVVPFVAVALPFVPLYRLWIPGVILVLPTMSPLLALAGFAPSAAAVSDLGWLIVTALAALGPAALTIRFAARSWAAQIRVMPRRH